jgi:hypothetical protein
VRSEPRSFFLGRGVVGFAQRKSRRSPQLSCGCLAFIPGEFVEARYETRFAFIGNFVI